MYLHLMKHKTQSQPFKATPGDYEFVNFDAQTPRTVISSNPASQSPNSCIGSCDGPLDQQAAIENGDRVVFRD